jgi:hypothetical protein
MSALINTSPHDSYISLVYETFVSIIFFHYYLSVWGSKDEDGWYMI